MNLIDWASKNTTYKFFKASKDIKIERVALKKSEPFYLYFFISSPKASLYYMAVKSIGRVEVLTIKELFSLINNSKELSFPEFQKATDEYRRLD